MKLRKMFGAICDEEMYPAVFANREEANYKSLLMNHCAGGSANNRTELVYVFTREELDEFFTEAQQETTSDQSIGLTFKMFMKERE